jgi:thiamine-monophosphate kinase
LSRFHQPNPRCDEGIALRGIASSCIDVSDGLLGDLGHILEQGNVGACLDFDDLPLSNAVRGYIDKTGDWLMPLTAGDDYELCFTVSPEKAQMLGFNCKKCGIIESNTGLRINKSGIIQTLETKAYEHFS